MPGFPRAGDLVIAVVVLTPIVVLLPSFRALPLDGAGVLITRLALASGVLGLSMMLAAAVLSARIPKLDASLGGLPRIWTIHRLLGFGAFMLILLHVALLAIAALPASPNAALSVLFPSFTWVAIWLGWASLVGMTFFLAPTFQFFGKVDYQKWKGLHLLSVPATLLALGHAIPLSREPIIWWVLGSVAVAAFVWRKLLSPRLARRSCVVSSVERLAPGVVEIGLAPDGDAFRHEPGQFIYMTPDDPALSAGNREEHPYTIASAPGGPELKLGIKDLGDASHALQSIAIGSRVWVEGPYGQFFERSAPGRGQLWLGGGIGITPFVSGARQIAAGCESGNPVCLFYFANRPERAYYLGELLQIAAERERFFVIPHFFVSEGPVTGDFLRTHCPDFEDREIYICGPEGMIRHLRGVLAEVGVDRALIHTEAFDFL